MYKRYGVDVWPLQYQVEVRTRVELFPRIKRDGLASWYEAEAEAKAKGEDFDESKHPFKKDKAWDYVFGKVLSQSESNWWMQQLELPALRLANQARRVTDFVGGDVPFAASGAVPRTALPDPLGHTAGFPPVPFVPAGSDRARKRARTRHNVANGHFVTTRTGMQICGDFNAGTCTETIQGNRCARYPTKSNVCSKCLQGRHTATGPPACTATPQINAQAKAAATTSAAWPAPKGKGKGGKPDKGKGKGKGKKGWGWWGC